MFGLVAGVVAGLGACADSTSRGAGNDATNNGAGFNNAAEPGGDINNDTNGGFQPEVELEFEFAEPAVVGSSVFVANETSNTVAVIDSASLAIRTIPVGFGPTRVVGPEAAVETSGVFVLNEGASTVSVVDPDTLETKTASVLRRANSLIANPRGEFALAWFDEARLEPGEQAGDLSSVTLVSREGVSHQVAVGFKVERITFTETGNTALVLTDDGVSIIRMTAVSGDEVAAPVAVLPPDLQSFDRTDREVLITPDGLHTIARAGNNPELVLTRLATGEQFRAVLPGTPTDLDWVFQEPLQLLAMVPSENIAVIAQVPEGVEALAALAPVPPVLPDAGTDAGGDAGLDAGDAGPDAGADAGLDADMDAGAPVEPGTTWSPAEGVTYLALEQGRLGAAEVDTDGGVGLLFSTLEGRRGGVLLDLDTLEQRSLAFEKGVRGAVPDPRGEAFVVLHTREEGGVPPTATPKSSRSIEPW